jgi:hypothetical protein
MPDTKAFVMLEVSIHLMSIPRVPNVNSVASSLKRNLRSSLETSAESQSQPRQLGRADSLVGFVSAISEFANMPSDDTSCSFI